MKRSLVALIALAMGCRANMTLVKPVDPHLIAVQTNDNAQLNAVVQVDNFSLGKIKTNFSEHDMEQFRADMPVLVGNGLFGLLGNAFRTIKRSAVGPPADFIVSGSYDHTSYFGTGGREWIPFAGTFGAPINEATIHEVLHVNVVDTRTGRSILDQQFNDDQEERTSIYSTAQGNWLQPSFLAKVAQSIVDAVRSVSGGAAGAPAASNFATQPQRPEEARVNSPRPSVPGEPAIAGINGRVANMVFFADDDIDPSRVSDSLHKCSSARPQASFQRDRTRFVWICTFIVPDGRFLAGSVGFAMDIRREKDRSLVTWLPAVTLEVKQSDSYAVVLQGYSAKDQGRIEAGNYVVGAFSNNEKVGEGSFAVH